MSGLLQRLLTAIVFVAVMVAGVFFNQYSFILLFGIITAGCLWEFLNITLKDNDVNFLFSRKIIGTFVGCFPYVASAFFSLGKIEFPHNYLISSALILFCLLFLVFLFELSTDSKKPFSNISYKILGLVYIGIPFTLLQFIAIDGESFYPSVVLGILLLTWANDTGAYVIGSQIGKTPLFPRISPKKTWEGSTGGVLATFLIGGLLSLVVTELSLTNWLVLAVIVSIFGSLGDLVESMLKRSVNIKDSGNLLPGHGGLLDRFDALLFLLPFAAAYLLWFR